MQQTGQVDEVNDRTLSAIGIVERCESRDVAAIKGCAAALVALNKRP